MRLVALVTKPASVARLLCARGERKTTTMTRPRGERAEEDAVTPSDIRTELLKEHEDLRERIARTQTTAQKCLDGSEQVAALRLVLTSLTDAVRKHNAHEEELLSDALRTVDDLDAPRRGALRETHEKEHRKLVFALVATYNQLDKALASKRALEICDQMLEHMAEEEKTFVYADAPVDGDPDAHGG